MAVSKKPKLAHSMWFDRGMKQLPMSKFYYIASYFVINNTVYLFDLLCILIIEDRKPQYIIFLYNIGNIKVNSTGALKMFV